MFIIAILFLFADALLVLAMTNGFQEPLLQKRYIPVYLLFSLEVLILFKGTMALYKRKNT